MTNIREKFLEMGEYLAAGLYEECDRDMFYRRSLGLRRYYETCDLPEYTKTPLYPSGAVIQKMNVVPEYMQGLRFHLVLMLHNIF